ncbi:unnamed protein product [Parnassius apollo]|uniref:(apollo) hypothetical protein n=1 Tax=Parnassius apollo TaxID=110799 RepID=A0A8S3YA83_PARAO|nr:unnamed protein product [Parnassius apollo]
MMLYFPPFTRISARIILIKNGGVKKKWTERDTVRVVELYEEEQVLWNENSDNSSSDSDVPAAPSPDIPAAASPDIPAAPSPDIPAAPSPDIPIAPSPDIPITPSPDIPIAPSPDILAEPSSDIPRPLPLPADLQTPSSSQQLNSEIFVKPQNTIK